MEPNTMWSLKGVQPLENNRYSGLFPKIAKIVIFSEVQKPVKCFLLYNAPHRPMGVTEEGHDLHGNVHFSAAARAILIRRVFVSQNADVARHREGVSC